MVHNPPEIALMAGDVSEATAPASKFPSLGTPAPTT
jgi:hypothetical protein